MNKGIIAAAAFSIGALLAHTANAGDQTGIIEHTHFGSQCDAVQFYGDPTYYGVAGNLAASPNYTPANSTQAVALDSAFEHHRQISFVLTGRYIQCKLAFGNGGKVQEISDIDK